MISDEYGNHGYNNSLHSMHPFFIARGPAFKQGHISEPFNNVDIYPLMCHILDIEPHKHDGSFVNVKHILRNSDDGLHFELSLTMATCKLSTVTIMPRHRVVYES